MKHARNYRLCRTVTKNEYCDVVATSLAEARRRAFSARSVRVRETRWREITVLAPSAPSAAGNNP